MFADKLKNTFSEIDSNGFDNTYKNKVDFINNKIYENNYSNKNVIQFTLKELNEVIQKLNNSKSIDPSGINNFIIKKLTKNSRLGLLKLYNKCLIENQIPAEWKTAEITMLHKKANDKSDFNNYRPISKSLAKLFEKLISVRLNNFLKENNLIVKHQSGFRQNRLTRDTTFFIYLKK